MKRQIVFACELLVTLWLFLTYSLSDVAMNGISMALPIIKSPSSANKLSPLLNYSSQFELLPFLVKDITSGKGSTIPNELASTSERVFFTVGQDLWVTDGTSSGTYSLAMAARHLNATNNILFFTNPEGTQLWRSNGIDNVMIADFEEAFNIICMPECFGSFKSVGETLYFTAVDHYHGTELWYVNELGHIGLVQDIYPGEHNSSDPHYLTNLGEALFFSANDGVHGYELWKYDGYLATLVKDIVPGEGGSYPWHMIGADEILFFAADDGVHGRELWKSDGTVDGTSLVKDILPGSGSSNPSWLMAVLNGTLFFVADDGIHGLELWKSDGTEEGTQLVKDINPDNTCDEFGYEPGSGSYPCQSGISRMVTANDLLFFTALEYSPELGYYLENIWVSDGSGMGTKPLHISNAGGPANLAWDYLFAYGNRFVFFRVAYSYGTTGDEIWQTEGEIENTRLIFKAHGVGAALPFFASTQNLVFFWGEHAEYGVELWGYYPVSDMIFLPVLSKR